MRMYNFMRRLNFWMRSWIFASEMRRSASSSSNARYSGVLVGRPYLDIVVRLSGTRGAPGE